VVSSTIGVAGSGAFSTATLKNDYPPSQIDFRNYAKLNDYGRGVWNYVGNSGGTAAMTMVGSTILFTLAGYGFSRFRFRAKNLLFVLILMIQFPSIPIPLFLILTGLKLQNTLLC